MFSSILVSIVHGLDVLLPAIDCYYPGFHSTMLFDSPNPIHSFHLTVQKNDPSDVRRALHHVTLLSCLLVVPPQDQGMNATHTKGNISTPLRHNSLLQQTIPRILRKKQGIHDLRAAFRKLQRPTGSSRSSSPDTNHAPACTLSTDPASLLSLSCAFECAHSVRLCSHDARQSAADLNQRRPQSAACQHAPTPARLHRKAALDNLHGAFMHYDHKVSGAPFVGAAPLMAPMSPLPSNEAVDAVVILSPDCGPVYISLPLPPPLRHDEVVADIPFMPRPLMQGIPVHMRAYTYTDLSIPHIWRGRSTRHH
jgi:hypothetical protein